MQTCRGSHTHTLVVDPNDKNNVYIYVSGTSFVRPGLKNLRLLRREAPDKDPNTALFRIDVIKVPLAATQSSQIVSSPRVFMDARTGAINGLNNGGSHSKDGLSKPSDTDQCHDITVYSAIGLAAGACSGNGILLDIKDPVHPKRSTRSTIQTIPIGIRRHFQTTERRSCSPTSGAAEWASLSCERPEQMGSECDIRLKGNKLNFANYYKLPAAQGDSENCVAHNGSLVPVPGRDIKVQAWYQGGISVMDFTDPEHPSRSRTSTVGLWIRKCSSSPGHGRHTGTTGTFIRQKSHAGSTCSN